MSSYMLTTSDNPFNPHTHFDEWYRYDTLKGYNTLGFLARLVYSSPGLSEPDQEAALDMAIDEVIRENILGIYEKVEAPS